MKNVSFVAFAVACGFIACKPREYNSDTKGTGEVVIRHTSQGGFLGIGSQKTVTYWCKGEYGNKREVTDKEWVEIWKKMQKNEADTCPEMNFTFSGTIEYFDSQTQKLPPLDDFDAWKSLCAAGPSDPYAFEDKCGLPEGFSTVITKVTRTTRMSISRIAVYTLSGISKRSSTKAFSPQILD